MMKIVPQNEYSSEDDIGKNEKLKIHLIFNIVRANEPLALGMKKV